MAPISRLKNVWRGEIQLGKTFWLFGVAVLCFFSFTFITSQGLFVTAFGKASKTPLYIDYFLTLILVSYGMFMVVAMWRSSNKYQGPKRWSRLAKLGGIVIVLWVTSNLGLYVFIKTIIPPPVETKMDYIPKKLLLDASGSQGESLYLGEFELKFPFYKEDIRDAVPFFYEDQFISMMIKIGNKPEENRGHILFDSFPIPSTQKKSFASKIWDVLFDDNYDSLVQTMGKVHRARLADYSWWNLRENVKLSLYLMLKMMSITAGNFQSFTMYETESPFLKGLLTDRRSEKNRHFIDFQFEGKRKTYDVFTFSIDEETSRKIMAMIGTIRPVQDLDKSYREIARLYEHKDESRYPEEVLLMSLISVKGPTLNEINELLQIEERKQDNKTTLDSIKAARDLLARSERTKR